MGLHDHTLKDLSGKDVKLDSYKGKVVLLENVATL
jgi:glutathione peroxidase-family protein